MPHFRVDAGLDSHPKSERAGDDALGMWVRAGSWCMRYLTDGFVPEWWVKKQPKGIAKAKKLVDSGFWIGGAERDGEKGFQFHEFLGPGRQDSREKIEADRELARKRKEKSRRESRRDSTRDTPCDERRPSRRESRRSPGYTQPNPTQEEQNSPTEVVSPNVGGDERGLAPTVSVSASRLIATLIPEAIPTQVRNSLRIAASDLMNGDGIDSDVMAETLRRWLAKPGAGAGLLPSLAADVVRERALPNNGIGKSTQKALGYRQLGAELIDEIHGG